MKRFVYVLLGMGIALGSGLLYSFKAKQTSEVSYAIVYGFSVGDATVYYSDGTQEKVNEVIALTKNDRRVEVALIKTLAYMNNKGYKTIGSDIMSNSGGPSFYYTLIKEN